MFFSLQVQELVKSYAPFLIDGGLSEDEVRHRLEREIDVRARHEFRMDFLMDVIKVTNMSHSSAVVFNVRICRKRRKVDGRKNTVTFMISYQRARR